jgi:phosphoadenosine phosphosulfate reductase
MRPSARSRRATTSRSTSTAGCRWPTRRPSTAPSFGSRTPDACCGIRKVTPLKRALSDVDCWVAGVRRAQADSRRFSAKLAFDERHKLWKANPLADWTEAQVWAYIDKHDVPYNPLHDRGYESIGCTHCTVPAAGREGRWAEAEKTECGLHG